MGHIAIIGGTGICDPTMLDHVTSGQMENYYGTIRYTRGTYKGKEIIFLARHGKYHSIPPHLINYRANILGLKKLGVTAILSTTAVGAINRDYEPDEFVLPDQFIDFTSHSRHGSFFDGGSNGVVHVDMSRTVRLCGRRLYRRPRTCRMRFIRRAPMSVRKVRGLKRRLKSRCLIN